MSPPRSARQPTSAAIILAGGTSRRMGTDKARLDLQGRTMLQTVHDALSPLFDEVIVSIARGANPPQGVCCVEDRHAGQGPLAGIEAAMASSDAEVFFVTACDTPRFDANLICRLMSLAEKHQAVAPAFGERPPEPLFAVYRRAAGEKARRLVEQGIRRVSALLENCEAHVLRLPENDWYCNLNTPAEYQAFLAGQVRDKTAAGPAAPAPNLPSAGLAALPRSLRVELAGRIRSEEAACNRARAVPDTLFGHLERVAACAARIARQEGLDPLAAELAGLFHDAGKFHGGQYHAGDVPEEAHSAAVLAELATKHGLDQTVVAEASLAIESLYRDDAEPTRLGKALFDADSLDKLGLVGVANYFVKAGLRGRGMSADSIIRLTVELTYARHACDGLYTDTGRAIAARRSAETIRFIEELLDTLKQDGIFDARIERIAVEGFELDLISPASCACGAVMSRNTWSEPGLECTEIHVELSCEACANRHKIRFCRPRLLG